MPKTPYRDMTPLQRKKRKAGKIGAARRAVVLSAKRRREIAKIANAARLAKRAARAEQGE